jgi:hypothetical protein
MFETAAALHSMGRRAMKRYAVVATHHKTGTVWMALVFRSIAKACDLPLTRIRKSHRLDAETLPFPSIVLSQHSDFEKSGWMLEDSRCRILHLIRDPRDILLSSMRYHRTATEPWLHKKRKPFKGQTYQEKINSLPDDHARYIFEMENSTGRVIRAIREWDYTRSNVMECRYEDLIGDIEMTIFTAALLHLGFEDDELDACRRAIRKNSLFGAVKKENNGEHIHSGEARQWKAMFDQSLAAEFIDRFGDVLIRLGYEKDNSWADSLPLTRDARETDTHDPATPAHGPAAEA